jgi:hypothetical protein
VLRNISYGGSFEARARIVPAYARARRMPIGVEAITRLRGEIDPADERHAVIDDNRFFVMAVHRPFVRIKCALDLRPSTQLLPNPPHLAPGGTEERKGSAGPDQHADIEALGQFREQIPKDYVLAVALERKIRSKVPPRQMNVRARSSEFFRDRRKGLLTVDENLNRIPWPHWWVTGGPTSNWGVERSLPSDPPQTTSMVTTDLAADLIAEPSLRCEGQAPKRTN